MAAAQQQQDDDEDRQGQEIGEKGKVHERPVLSSAGRLLLSQERGPVHPANVNVS
jgi:hypothetical protein